MTSTQRDKTNEKFLQQYESRLDEQQIAHPSLAYIYSWCDGTITLDGTFSTEQLLILAETLKQSQVKNDS